MRTRKVLQHIGHLRIVHHPLASRLREERRRPSLGLLRVGSGSKSWRCDEAITQHRRKLVDQHSGGPAPPTAVAQHDLVISEPDDAGPGGK